MKKYISHIVLGILIICMMGASLWSSGGIILLDYIATDHASIPWFQNGWYLIPQIPSSILGYEWGTKVSFVTILILSAYLGILLARRISDLCAPGYRTMLEIFGGVFFLTNPFAYERMMVQPVIYLGTILIGYALYFLLFSRDSKLTLRRAGLIGLTLGIALNVFLHASYMILAILALYSILFVRSLRDTRSIAYIGGIILVLNLNWILAPLFGIRNSVTTISSFSLANFEAFATQALAPLEVFGTNILLYGFWGEQFANHYANVDFLSSLWYVAGFMMLSIVLYGFSRVYTLSKKLFIFCLLLSTLSLTLGVGITSPITAPLTHFLIEYAPLFAGYREPQKWIGLLMIVEGIGFLFGVAFILERWGRDRVVRSSLCMTILILFLVWSPGSLFGYHGQLRTTVYPRGFEELREILLETQKPGLLPSSQGQKVLALPWHSYLGCSWTGRPTISNPIASLMSPHSLVSSDNIEAGSILYSNSIDPVSESIEAFLRLHDFAPLGSLGFTHILLMRECANSESYAWLDTMSSCSVAYDDAAVRLYSCR